MYVFATEEPTLVLGFSVALLHPNDDHRISHIRAVRGRYVLGVQQGFSHWVLGKKKETHFCVAVGRGFLNFHPLQELLEGPWGKRDEIRLLVSIVVPDESLSPAPEEKKTPRKRERRGELEEKRIDRVDARVCSGEDEVDGTPPFAPTSSTLPPPPPSLLPPPAFSSSSSSSSSGTAQTVACAEINGGQVVPPLASNLLTSSSSPPTSSLSE